MFLKIGVSHVFSNSIENHATISIENKKIQPRRQVNGFGVFFGFFSALWWHLA